MDVSGANDMEWEKIVKILKKYPASWVRFIFGKKTECFKLDLKEKKRKKVILCHSFCLHLIIWWRLRPALYLLLLTQDMALSNSDHQEAYSFLSLLTMEAGPGSSRRDFNLIIHMSLPWKGSSVFPLAIPGLCWDNGRKQVALTCLGVPDVEHHQLLFPVKLKPLSPFTWL